MATGIELAQAWVRLTPTMEGVQGEVSKALGPAETEAEAAGKRSGDKFSTGMKAAMTVASAALVAGVVSVFNTGLEELKFGEEINAQTQVLLDNTNFALSVDKINDYTLALSKLSGVSEEDLQQAGNEILKFGNVSEENYLKALDSINDLAAGGKDAGSVATALGKALADPAKAAGVLKKSGVILNEEQKTLIDNFIAAGDVASAQGVILDTLEGTYGGMAEAAGGTLSGGIEKLNNQWENLAGSIVEGVMPAVTGLVEILGGVMTFMEENPAVVTALSIAVGVLTLAIVGLTVAMWIMSLTPVMLTIAAIVIGVGLLIAAIVWLVLEWDNVIAFLSEAWTGFVGWFTGVLEGFVGWWNGVWTGFANWIGEVWNGFIGFLKDVWNGFTNWLISVVSGFIGWWNGVWTGLGGFISDVWKGFIGFLTDVWNGFLNWLTNVVMGFVSWWNGIWTGLGGFISDVWNGFIGFISDVWLGFQNWLFGVVAGFMSWWNSTWTGLATFFTGLWSGILGFIGDVFNNIGNVIQGALNWISNTWNNVWQGMVNFLGTAFSNVVGVIKAPINAIIGLINGAIGALNDLSVTIPDWVPGLGGQTFGLSLPNIPYLAKGGTITRSGYTMVGEQGPELLKLPTGAQVNPDYDDIPDTGVKFYNYAPLGQTPAQALTEFSNRAKGL